MTKEKKNEKEAWVGFSPSQFPIHNSHWGDSFSWLCSHVPIPNPQFTILTGVKAFLGCAHMSLADAVGNGQITQQITKG